MVNSIYILIFVFFATFSASSGAEVHMYPGETIQSAIERANVGDALYVNPSVYRENLVISKPLFLKGMAIGETKPIIDADGHGNAILISAEGVSIEGFIIVNAKGDMNQSGICIISNNSEIRDNILQNNGYGIFILNGSGNVVRGNFLCYNNYGINIKNSSNITVYENILFNNTAYDAYDTGDNNWFRDNAGNYYNDLIYNIPGGKSKDLHPIGVKNIDSIDLEQYYTINSAGKSEDLRTKSLINYIYIFIASVVVISFAVILILRRIPKNPHS